ncbi:MAG: hypothetical protein EB127_11215 [Alphaproteobacteria bacterium]|nr:hypothetical protein [Alphaproteobacteria bacterium]
MHINEAITLINNTSAEDLKALTSSRLMDIIQGMNKNDIGRFLFEKNVKIFGGIDGYVTDFLDKTKLKSMNSAGKSGAKIILEKMLVYPGISDVSKKRIQDVIHQTDYETATAAGGKRNRTKYKIKKHVRRSKKRGLKQSRVKR